MRLYDGSTIRRRFSINQSLGIHVRPWIGEHGSDYDSPYTIKQILAPLPNRTFSVSEEKESLHSLGLTPSATLVVVPVRSHFAAYPGDQSILSRGVSAVYHLFNSLVNIIIGIFRTFLATAQTTPTESQANSAPTHDQGPLEHRSSVDTGPRINVRTLRDQGDDHDDHQFYNGNQVSQRPAKVKQKLNIL